MDRPYIITDKKNTRPLESEKNPRNKNVKEIRSDVMTEKIA